MVGPFIKYGPEVVEACLAAGCHYTDTTGEQDWVSAGAGALGHEIRGKGLLLAPNIAQMYTTGEIAANICLETPGLDTLDILVFCGREFPTYASTQTILHDPQGQWYYLEQNKFVEWARDRPFRRQRSRSARAALALPWGGTAHPVWFKNDPRVANCKVLGGVMQRDVCWAWCRSSQEMVEEKIKPLPPDQQEKALADIAGIDASHHAAARESAHQHLDRLGLCLGPAGRAPIA